MTGPFRRRHPRNRFARNGSLRIGYELHRRPWSRRPWLLLVQGLGFDRTGWEPVIPGLRRRFRLILMDNRGCGVSDPSPRGFSVDALAADAIAVLDAAGVRRAHVLGASLGGMVAQEVAIRHPDRVNGLVLACTTPGWPSGYPLPAPALRLLIRGGVLPPATALRRFTENALSATTLAQRPELVDRLVRHQTERPVPRAALGALNRAGARYHGGNRQTRIVAPTLVLHGTADTVVDPRNAELLAGRIPGAQLELLPGLGHLFFWERPESLVDPVTSFLVGAGRKPAAVAHTGAVHGDGERTRR